MKTVDKIKMLCSLINEGNATIEEQIEYYELIIEIANNETECGKRMIERHQVILDELKKQLKVNEVIEIPSDKIKRYKTIKEVEFKRGDEIIINFIDGGKSEVKITNVRFGFYYKNSFSTNRDKVDRMYIDYVKEDKEEYECDTVRIKSIEIIGRSKKSKKVLLEDNKSLDSYIGYWGK